MGPVIHASAFIPDLNCFHSRHGMAFPLYRNATGTDPNVTTGLLAALGAEYGKASVPGRDMTLQKRRCEQIASTLDVQQHCI